MNTNESIIKSHRIDFVFRCGFDSNFSLSVALDSEVLGQKSFKYRGNAEVIKNALIHKVSEFIKQEFCDAISFSDYKKIITQELIKQGGLTRSEAKDRSLEFKCVYDNAIRKGIKPNPKADVAEDIAYWE